MSSKSHIITSSSYQGRSDDSPSATRTEVVTVLVSQCEVDAELGHSVWQRIAELVPGIEIVLSRGESEYREILERSTVDVVVFLWPAGRLVEKMLLPELKLRNEAPGMIVVAAAEDPVTVATLYNLGCHRFVPQLDGWQVELSQALRGVLRSRRADSVHERTRARLTEMLSLVEEKNARLDEFSVTLAHDVRGPLAGISMKLDYILDTYQEELPERAQNFIGKALESTRRLTDLVQAMYEYARLGAKASEFSCVELESLVKNAISDLHVDERLDVRIGVAELPSVWGKAELLQRVFLNLVQNAIKYSDKSEIIINVSCEGIEERALGSFADIVVSDNGPGIPEDSRATLFSMFSRLHRNQTTGQAVEGLGAGLAVVQRVVELHFGKIWVENAEGGGARFVLRLPTGPVEVN